MIPFNKPYLTGKESELIDKAFSEGKFSGNGYFTKKCHTFFKDHFGFENCFLTNSATSALEMSAILCGIERGDEVILPSYTFVSTATPFALRGANIVFCDSEASSPNMDVQQLKALITPKTKAIVVVHYSGLSCDMDAIMALAAEHNIFVIEDAAHCITSRYKDSFLGSIGHFAAFSFHETKNISSGQGGMLVVNEPAMVDRAEKIWSKGTNRLDMERGNVDKYEWVDLGSNFYPSEITAALLYAQLLDLDHIQNTRKQLWEAYSSGLHPLENEGKVQLPSVKEYQSNNYHIFYLVCATQTERDSLIAYLRENGVLAVFHYLPLHKSPYIQEITSNQEELPNAEHYAETLVRLPLFVELKPDEVKEITQLVLAFYTS
ncbi:MAG: dTDP-4-amino-4,6-dideoxygalactose transaminase [Crocinitomicaceae bacterium]|nr:dTDP-4-amino-4,6-dideoxygalactose transaminase [Crocinitomicaceae bacterium]